MQAYIDLLNTYFKDKSSFYIIDDSQTKTPSDVIVELNKLNYVFTQTDFNNFLVNATYKKRSSYISRSFYKSTNTTNRTEAIHIMFTKFTPTDKQFKQLISCSGYRYSNNYWVDVLVARQYVFTDDQKSQLVKIGYDLGKLYSNGTVTINELKLLIQSVLETKTPIKTLSDIINKNQIIYPTDFTEWFIDIFQSNYNSYKMYISVMDLLFAHNVINLTDNTITHIIKNNCHSKFVTYLLNKGLIIHANEQLMSYCSTIGGGSILVLKLHKEKNIPITINMMNNVLKCLKYSLDEPISISLTSLGYNKELIDLLCAGNVNYKELDCDKFLIASNIVPNKETFEIACKNHNQLLFDYCVKKHNMMPTKEHLKISLLNRYNSDLHFIENLLCYKIIPDSECLDFLTNIFDSPFNKQIVDLLIKFGFTPTIDDIKTLLIHKIYINNLEGFNLKYDETLYYFSHIYDSWGYVDKIILKDHKMLELRKLCRSPLTSNEQLDQYIKTNEVKLDRYCLEHACLCNERLANYMLQTLKCKPTTTMFYWLTRKYHYHDSYYNLLNDNKINDEYLSEKIH